MTNPGPIRGAMRFVAELQEGSAPAGTILVVDDEPLLRKSLRRILESDEHHVLLASGAVEMREHLERPHPDVILLDLVLGNTSGLEVLAEIRRDWPEIAVIVMTGHATIESAVGCMRQGAFDYIEKPFIDPHRIQSTVRAALARHRTAGATTRFAGRDLPPARPDDGEPGSRPVDALPLSLEAYERSALERALREEKGDATAAARRLGIGRSTLYRKLAKQGLRPHETTRFGVSCDRSIG